MKLYKLEIAGRSFEGGMQTIIEQVLRAGVSKAPTRLTTEGVWQRRNNDRQAWKPMSPGPRIRESLVQLAQQRVARDAKRPTPSPSRQPTTAFA